jgi:uncharacterized membrane protein YfcA
MTYVLIFVGGAIAYIISTLSGGGGSLLLVPFINFFVAGKAASPIVNLGNLIGEPMRMVLFWKNIQWKIVKYYLPPAIIGTIIGAWLFANIKLEWLQIIVGIFLVSTIFQYRFGKKERSFEVKLTYFIPIGFAVEFLSSLIGATGPVLNPFYLNYGIEKEKMIATKTANSFFIGLVQVSTFAALGSLKGNYWLYGILLGLGASLGNWIGKKFLKKISNETFRKLVLGVMVVSGIVMIAKQIGKL